MNNNLEYEYEIDLKDLCVSVLRKWRQIILAAVIGAVLLGGFRLVQNLTSETSLVMSESEIEKAQVDIEAAEEEIFSLERSVERVEMKLESNESMIDSFNERIASAQERLENLNSTLDNYNAVLEKMMDADNLDAEALDTMSGYLMQVDTLLSNILSRENEILNLYDSISELETENLELQDEIADYEDQITEQEEVIADLEEQMEEETSVSTTSKVATYIVLGAFIGVCCVCAYAFLKYCFDKTIHLEGDLSSYTANPVLASVAFFDGNQNRKQNVIDRLIDRIEGVDTRTDHSVDTQCAIAAAKIQVLAEKKKLLVTGTISEELLQKISHSLEEQLPQSGFEVLCAANPMVSAGDILKVMDYEIVLVEAPHMTKVRELMDLNGFLRLSGAKVVGIVAVAVS